MRDVLRFSSSLPVWRSAGADADGTNREVNTSRQENETENESTHTCLGPQQTKETCSTLVKIVQKRPILKGCIHFQKEN